MQTKTSYSLKSSLKKPTKNTYRTTFVFLAILACLIFFLNTQFSPSKRLEKLIDDEKVWQEVKDLPLNIDNFDKLFAEIEGIKSNERKGNPCDQYVLLASLSGWYFCEHSGKIFLQAGETWKIGKTCLDEKIRYGGSIPDKRLRFKSEFSGTAEQCLIVEKIKLYAYFLSPENQKREIPLILPPGNKIFR